MISSNACCETGGYEVKRMFLVFWFLGHSLIRFSAQYKCVTNFGDIAFPNLAVVYFPCFFVVDVLVFYPKWFTSVNAIAIDF